MVIDKYIVSQHYTLHNTHDKFQTTRYTLHTIHYTIRNTNKLQTTKYTIHITHDAHRTHN